MNLPKHLLKNIDLISAKLLAEKKDKLTLRKTTAETRKYFILTRTLAEKCGFYFYQNLCQEKTCLDKLDNQADFENLVKPTTNKANQNLC